MARSTVTVSCDEWTDARFLFVAHFEAGEEDKADGAGSKDGADGADDSRMTFKITPVQVIKVQCE